MRPAVPKGMRRAKRRGMRPAETFQAYANADPANSREDEINAEEKSENVEA
jgi:hypothetical protein